MPEDTLIQQALSDANLEQILLPMIPEVKLWVTLEEIDARYRGQLRAPSYPELELYGAVVGELSRRGAKVDAHRHLYRSYCGAKKCEHL